MFRRYHWHSDLMSVQLETTKHEPRTDLPQRAVDVNISPYASPPPPPTDPCVHDL